MTSPFKRPFLVFNSRFKFWFFLFFFEVAVNGNEEKKKKKKKKKSEAEVKWEIVALWCDVMRQICVIIDWVAYSPWAVKTGENRLFWYYYIKKRELSL